MKKKIFLWTSIVILILIATSKIYSWYCLKDNFNPNFKIGVLETTVYKNLSLLTLYDEDMNPVGRQKFDYGYVLAMNFDRRQNHKGNVFILPNGSECIDDKEKLIEYNPKTGEHITYDIKQSMNNSYATTDDYVFVVCRNIARCNRKTGNVDYLSIDKLATLYMNAYDDKLYIFGIIANYERHTEDPYLYIVDINDFKITDKINLYDYGCGSGQLSSVRVGDCIYFSNHTTPQNEPGKSFSSFNIKTKEVKTYPLEEIKPDQILHYENKLYIAHCGLPNWQTDAITIFDLDTQEQKLVRLKNNPKQIEIYNGKLYSIDLDDMYIYDLKTFDLLKQAQIRQKRHKGVNAHFFAAGFFINN